MKMLKLHNNTIFRRIIGYRLINKFRYIWKELNNKEFNLLDIGCGNHSPQITKLYFPKVNYYGVDITSYNNDELDFKVMKQFYHKDLEKDSIDDIPNNFFDVIIVSHVIEHLSNGLEVIDKLAKKIKTNGYIYIEFPSLKSLSLHSMKGTLHFCDDNSHKKLYSLIDICNILLSNEFKIIKAGTRRNIWRIILTPIQLLRHPFKGGTYWDLFGFAEFCIAKKIEK